MFCDFDNLGFLSTDIAAKGDLAALREAIEDMFEIGEASEKAPTGSNTEETKEKLKNKYRIPLE